MVRVSAMRGPMETSSASRRCQERGRGPTKQDPKWWRLSADGLSCQDRSRWGGDGRLASTKNIDPSAARPARIRNPELVAAAPVGQDARDDGPADHAEHHDHRGDAG